MSAPSEVPATPGSEEMSSAAAEALDRALHAGAAGRFVLRLYVAGATRASARAVANLATICRDELEGRCELEVIDVLQYPEAARRDQVIAVPVLIKMLPLPLRRLIGDLSDKERVLAGLDLIPKEA